MNDSSAYKSFQGHCGNFSAFGNDVLSAGRYVGRGILGTVLAFRDSAFIEGGLGIGFGGDLKATENLRFSLSNKVDIWSFTLDSAGFHKTATQEASAGGQIWRYNFGVTKSLEKDGWYDVYLDDFNSYFAEGEWKDTGEEEIGNRFSVGLGAYWLVGGSYEMGFDLNKLIYGIASSWAK